MFSRRGRCCLRITTVEVALRLAALEKINRLSCDDTSAAASGDDTETPPLAKVARDENDYCGIKLNLPDASERRAVLAALNRGTCNPYHRERGDGCAREGLLEIRQRLRVGTSVHVAHSPSSPAFRTIINILQCLCRYPEDFGRFNRSHEHGASRSFDRHAWCA